MGVIFAEKRYGRGRALGSIFDVSAARAAAAAPQPTTYEGEDSESATTRSVLSTIDKISEAIGFTKPRPKITPRPATSSGKTFGVATGAVIVGGLLLLALLASKRK